MLRRLLFAYSTAALLAGCVVPVAPEWSNPDRNYPPSIASATPPIGSVLGGDADGGSASLTVEVVLADQNTQDDLYLRWIIDYPPPPPTDNPLAYQTIQPGGSSVLRAPESFALNCSYISYASSNHRLMLAVSDRRFGAGPDEKTQTDQYVVEAVWPFILNCE